MFSILEWVRNEHCNRDESDSMGNKMRNKLYQWFIGDATDCCYRSCLDYFHENALILDVGIGNGVMVKDFHMAIKKKRLKIIGLDIDSIYLHHCRELLTDYDLSDQIKVFEQPVEDFRPDKNAVFDFILFSMSFMLMEDQESVLRRVSNWLKPEGEVVFFQTMFKSRNRLIEKIKPRLKHLTTIEFGEVTYDDEFYALLKRENLRVRTDRCIKKTWYNGTYRLIAAHRLSDPRALQ